MKKFKLLTLLFSLMVSFTCFSQTAKGTLLLGSVNYNTANEDGYLTFSPHIGYFVTDKIALGSSFAFIGGDDFVSALGPYLKIYFGKGTIGKFFTQLKVVAAIEDYNLDDLIYGWTLNAGYSFFIHKKISMDYSVQYSKIQSYYPIVGLNVGFNFHLFKSE